jgi:hypothetical protein
MANGRWRAVYGIRERQAFMAMPKDFVPTREGDLDEFVHNFDSRITASPTTFGLTAADATAFHALVVAWDAAYSVTKNRGTRSQSAVIVKDEKKFAMVTKLRELARIVQAYPGTTNEDRSLLGLTVPSERQPQPAPAFAPKLNVVKVDRNLVSVQLRDAQNLSRVRPDFARAANVFSFVGETAPTTSEGWYFQGGTTKARFDVAFDASLPMGTKVWLTAFWKNERDQSGPACDPVAVVLLGGGALPGAEQQSDGEGLSIAA